MWLYLQRGAGDVPGPSTVQPKTSIATHTASPSRRRAASDQARPTVAAAAVARLKGGGTEGMGSAP